MNVITLDALILASLCILYNQRDPTYTVSFIVISAQNVSGGFSSHHQELIKLYMQRWILSCFPAVYRWCGWSGTVPPQPQPFIHIFSVLIHEISLQDFKTLDVSCCYDYRTNFLLF